ncbi:MAG: tetraacyldisaccharide 4'-kinase [Victivallales bacterium]|nr:tetraacyldisaccharide 4'-kinase [Victivallales bacterium]
MSLHDFCEKTEQYVVDIINGRQTNAIDRIFRRFLFVLSRLYLNITQLRLALYENSLLKQHELGCTVISVGNLTTGGTGKTPVVELLSKTLAERKRHVAILSRGYRSKPKPFLERLKAKWSHDTNAFPPKVVSNGTKVLLDSQHAGDEPFMLASNLLATPTRPGVVVVVDKDRVKGGNYAITHLQADTLILDDGFQYLRLRPLHNILLVDSTNPFHNHEMLPAGLLREPIENLRRANVIFITKSNGAPCLRHLRAFIKRHNPSAAIIECNHEPKNLQHLDTREILPLESLKGKKVAALSAIAVPKSFLNYITRFGGNIVYSKHFVDHHRFKDEELEDFYANARQNGAEILVTTEKDAVRIPPLKDKSIPFYFLRIEIKILKGEEEFNKCITQICLE